jgi:predicted Fe-Mo cluster-binding NifX family protein
MKLSVPVKMNRENPPVAPLFGKAKWFAIVDIESGKIDIVENKYSGGQAVVEWLNSIGVEVLLVQEIGASPYQRLKEYDIALYHTGYDRILLNDAIKKFENNELVLLDDTNIEDVLKHHNGRNRNGHGKNRNYR